MRGDAIDGLTGTMVTALKFAVPVGKVETFQELLPSFLRLLADDDISVRRQAFLTLNNVLHKDFVNHVKVHLDTITPLLYAETKVLPTTDILSVQSPRCSLYLAH
jgi:hypothetical protein